MRFHQAPHCLLGCYLLICSGCKKYGNMNLSYLFRRKDRKIRGYLHKTCSPSLVYPLSSQVFMVLLCRAGTITLTMVLVGQTWHLQLSAVPNVWLSKPFLVDVLNAFKMLVLLNVHVCDCVCRVLLKRSSWIPKSWDWPWNGSGFQTDSCFNIRCISLWDYLCSRNWCPCVACQRCHGGFRDGTKEPEPSAELQVSCMALEGSSGLHWALRASKGLEICD